MRSKPKGSAFEREFARSAGGKRQVLSGAAGGNDIAFEPGALWNDWGWECKRRKQLPVFVIDALTQAEAAIPRGSAKRPAVAMREDRGRILVAFYWEDLRVWCEALAEMGQGHRIKPLARQLRAVAQELEGLA